MKKAIFPGSFNPFHEGHLSIYNKASKLFDEVVIYVSYNHKKNNLNSITERANAVKQFLPKAKIIQGKELTVKVAKREKCDYLIRGVRNTKDMEFEFNLAVSNKLLNTDIETVLLFADKDVQNISSTSLKLIQKIKK